jgi:hypothetical protein
MSTDGMTCVTVVVALTVETYVTRCNRKMREIDHTTSGGVNNINVFLEFKKCVFFKNIILIEIYH